VWDAAAVAGAVETALVAECCRASAMSWLRAEGVARPRLAWHVWHEGALYVVSGGHEQDLPPMPPGTAVSVTVRSKDNGARLVTWTATASRVEPGSPEWEAVVPVLHAKRLNPPDGEEQPARWARESIVTRLEPSGVLTESPGRMPRRSHAATPPDSAATTRGPLPFVLGRRARRRR
jgi:hypothetical protein